MAMTRGDRTLHRDTMRKMEGSPAVRLKLSTAPKKGKKSGTILHCIPPKSIFKEPVVVIVVVVVVVAGVVVVVVVVVECC